MFVVMAPSSTALRLFSEKGGAVVDRVESSGRGAGVLFTRFSAQPDAILALEDEDVTQDPKNDVTIQMKYRAILTNARMVVTYDECVSMIDNDTPIDLADGKRSSPDGAPLSEDPQLTVEGLEAIKDKRRAEADVMLQESRREREAKEVAPASTPRWRSSMTAAGAMGNDEDGGDEDAV